jgi:hypothetical protein
MLENEIIEKLIEQLDFTRKAAQLMASIAKERSAQKELAWLAEVQKYKSLAELRSAELKYSLSSKIELDDLNTPMPCGHLARYAFTDDPKSDDGSTWNCALCLLAQKDN